MRVKRSEAYKTRVETRRQNTLLVTAFSNVLNNTSDSMYADTDTLRDAEYEARKKRDQDALVTEHEEAVLAALRTALNSAPDHKRRENKGPDLAETFANHNSVAVSSSAFGMAGDPALSAQDIYQHQPSSFVRRGAHVLSNASDAELNSTLNVILRGDNSEAVFHYTGDDIKRLLLCYLESIRQS